MDSPIPSLDDAARALLREATEATASAPNEASLRHELENALEEACRQIRVPWIPWGKGSTHSLVRFCGFQGKHQSNSTNYGLTPFPNLVNPRKKCQ
jgi:hypothetical protein